MGNFMDSLVAVTDSFDGWLYSTVLFWALIIVGLFLHSVQNLYRSGCSRKASVC